MRAAPGARVLPEPQNPACGGIRKKKRSKTAGRGRRRGEIIRVSKIPQIT